MWRPAHLLARPEVVVKVPNAIYPPRWHPVPPPEHPALDRWLILLVSLVVLILVVSAVLDIGA